MYFTQASDDLLDGRFEFRQSGTFRVLSLFAAPKIIIACIIEVMIAPYTLSVLFYGGAISNNSSIIVIKIALAVILPILPVWYILIVAGGERQYRYEANGKTMRIYNKRHTYIFRYCDVRNVKYIPLKPISRQVGYTVTVTSKYDTVIFRYLTPRKAEFTQTASTPFAILERKVMKHSV